MAGYNELLVGRYNRFLQKLMSMKGSKSLESLNPELHVTLQTLSGVENRYLEGWNRYGLQVQQTGQASVTSGARWRNPSGSGVIAVIEKVLYSNFTGISDDGQMLLGAASTDLTNIATTTNARFDPRGNPTPSLVVSSQTGPPTIGAGTAKIAWVANNVSNYDMIQDEDQEFPLLPGDAMQFQTVAVNIQLNVSVFWRERALEESERS